MPQRSKYKLKKQNFSKDSLGERIAKFRKEKGLTQIEIAKAIGITQTLISAYERGRLRPNYEIIAGFAQALDVTTDELIGLKQSKTSTKNTSLKILKRLNKIEKLPPSQQRALLQTIDNYLRGVEAQQETNSQKE